MPELSKRDQSATSEQRLADDLAGRLIPIESAEVCIDRIEHYLTSPYPVSSQTRLMLSLAAIRKWRRDHGA